MLGIETEQNRIFGLDFLRAIAIFFVVHGHGAFLLNDTHFAFFNKTPFPDVVDIFFVLTGFLIGSSFLSYAKKTMVWIFGKRYGSTHDRHCVSFPVIL